MLGVSTAYVLLGGRHAGGSNAPHPKALPGTPPFLIRKSSRRVPLSFPAVTNVHGVKWMAELQEMCEAAEAKLTLNGKELVRPKNISAADDDDKPELHAGDLYLCAESLEALEGALGGVLDAVDLVFSSEGPRRCFACVRPPGHHCSSDYPSGFCWLNNVHVGISHGASSYGLTHAAIFDFDLHHGDGSQSITWDHNVKVSSLPKNASISKKTKIGYFSLHDINSYPCEWGDEDKVRNASLCIENAHGQTIWNVHMQSWKTDAEFWELYNDRYSVLLTKMRTFLRTQNEKFHSLGHGSKSKGAIFISAGFDASEWEGQGMQRHAVNVPTDFYAKVTRDIAAMSDEGNLGVDGRVISVLEGGYSDRALMSGALSHVCGLASTPADDTLTESNFELATSAKTLARAALNGAERKTTPLPLPYQYDWWSPSRLEEIESVVSPAPAAPVSRKPRGGLAPTYQTPTQSFVAKVVSPPTYQRSISGSMMSRPNPVPRPPTPPPPDVEWAVASQELSQILIPQDRSTKSCRSEDLNAKATEARKTRQSLIGTVPEVPIEDMQKMQLRDRKAKQPIETQDASRPPSRASAARRRTIGGVELLEQDATSTSKRRVSVASSILSNSEDLPANSMNLQLEPFAPPKPKAPPKARAARKAPTKPPVPRVPSTFKQGDVLQRPEGTANGVSSVSRQSPDTEMANLASDVKKLSIKLNVPPREEYEARKQASAAGPKTTATTKVPPKTTTARAPRKPAVKKSAKEPSKVTKTILEPKNGAHLTENSMPMVQPTLQPTALEPPINPPTLSSVEHNVGPLASWPENDAPQFTSTIYKDITGVDTAPPSFQAPDAASMTATVTAPMPALPDFPSTRISSPTMPIPQAPAPPPAPLPSGTTSAPASTFSSPKSIKQNNLPIFTSSSAIPFGPSPIANLDKALLDKSTNAPVDKDVEEKLSDKTTRTRESL